ncbi:unnamed protein product [Schistocephalus solidus]|uniref:Perilipin-5 n=1 Tax=Schistocephalus solidus TaxID=70667 RepID=A0A183TJW7_SCHSO|nr:unnamed protein product [Schistocephalus solidus]
MAEFSKRVAHYPVVTDSLKAASDAYTWVSSGERFKSIFQLSEQAANVLKEKAKALASTGAVSQLDDVACRQILDRIESVLPHVKKPTEDLLGPIADRALTAAESYLEYFIPSVKDSEPEGSQPLSRYDRLMRLQSALAGSEKVQAAQSTIASVYQKMQDSLNSLLSPSHLAKTVGEAEKQTREMAIATFSGLVSQYQSAAAIAFPKFKSFVDGSVTQTQNLITELRQADSVSQYAVEQTRAVLNGLHSTLTSLNERRESWMHSLISDKPELGKEATEMQELHPSSEVGPLFHY